MMQRRRPSTAKGAARARHRIDGLLDVEFFKALADPVRLRLLATMAKCSTLCTVGELAGTCKVHLSVVSRHLRALREAGIVEADRSDGFVWCHVAYDDLADRFRALADVFEECAAVEDEPAPPAAVPPTPRA